MNNPNGPKQFKHSHIHDMGTEKKRDRFVFSEGMIGACGPLFEHLYSNYDVEELLRKVGVIRKNQRTDSESCCMYVYFSSRKSGEAFINRLNQYLTERWAMIFGL